MRTTMYAAAMLAVLLVPMPAQAEWYVTPYFGAHFSGAADVSLIPGADAETQPWNVGVTGGWMKGWLGIDADLAQYPRFFDDSGGFISDTSLMTLMGNARVAIPWGQRMRPYATAGAGMLRPNLSEPGGLAVVDDAKFAWNVGGGVTGFFSQHAGVQGEVRYFRANDDEGATNPFGVEFNGFDFARASVGITFKW